MGMTVQHRIGDDDRVKMGLSLVLAGFVAVVLLAGFALPKHAYVARRVLIEAPVELVWPDVGSLDTWPQWTDWNRETDPSYDPKPEGSNKLTWTRSQAGPGEQLITESDPVKGIRYRLELQGGKYRVDGRLAFKADGTRTYVTWIDSIDVAHSYVGRYMGAALDPMLGPKIEKSLLALKRRAEDRAKQKGVVAVPAPALPDPALTPPPAAAEKPAEPVKEPPTEEVPAPKASPPQAGKPPRDEAPAVPPQEPAAAPENEPAVAREAAPPAPEPKPPAPVPKPDQDKPSE
jgi:hypothetical protein